MGYDDEYLEPKQRSLKVNNNTNKYLIEYNNVKREISASSYKDLIDNVRIQFELDADFKLEAFFESYQDWIVIDSLPDNQSKLRILLNR